MKAKEYEYLKLQELLADEQALGEGEIPTQEMRALKAGTRALAVRSKIGRGVTGLLVSALPAVVVTWAATGVSSPTAPDFFFVLLPLLWLIFLWIVLVRLSARLRQPALPTLAEIPLIFLAAVLLGVIPAVFAILIFTGVAASLALVLLRLAIFTAVTVGGALLLLYVDRLDEEERHERA